MRKEWMGWVAKTRKKGNRGKGNSMSHREALRAAAVTWPKEKAKLLKRQKRACKVKVVETPPAQIPDALGDENAGS